MYYNVLLQRSMIVYIYMSNIIWYNPPDLTYLKTNISKIFFKLLNKHFPIGLKFYKIFNKNTVKLIYSSTKNMAP